MPSQRHIAEFGGGEGIPDFFTGVKPEMTYITGVKNTINPIINNEYSFV